MLTGLTRIVTGYDTDLCLFQLIKRTSKSVEKKWPKRVIEKLSCLLVSSDDYSRVLECSSGREMVTPSHSATDNGCLTAMEVSELELGLPGGFISL